MASAAQQPTFLSNSSFAEADPTINLAFSRQRFLYQAALILIHRPRHVMAGLDPAIHALSATTLGPSGVKRTAVWYDGPYPAYW
jgi:hypothetical protein